MNVETVKAAIAQSLYSCDHWPDSGYSSKIVLVPFGDYTRITNLREGYITYHTELVNYHKEVLCTSRFGRALQDIERAVELNTRDELAKQFDEALKFNREMAKESMKLRGPNFTLDQLVEQEDLFQQGMKSMEASKWDEAEQALQASIAMGDCLPQPWGNLGICLMMQERYDEAEAALNRALLIDPKYSIAKNNLALLAKSRLTGPPKIMGISDPFKNTKMKQSITFVKQ